MVNVQDILGTVSSKLNIGSKSFEQNANTKAGDAEGIKIICFYPVLFFSHIFVAGSTSCEWEEKSIKSKFEKKHK